MCGSVPHCRRGEDDLGRSREGDLAAKHRWSQVCNSITECVVSHSFPRHVFEAARRAKTVKKIVMTSSVAAVYHTAVRGKIYTDDDWNSESTMKTAPYNYAYEHCLLGCEFSYYGFQEDASRKVGVELCDYVACCRANGPPMHSPRHECVHSFGWKPSHSRDPSVSPPFPFPQPLVPCSSIEMCLRSR